VHLHHHNVIESCVIQQQGDPEYECLIWDGMVLLQQLASVHLASFGDVADHVLKRILKRPVVYFVTDQYKPGSIKSYERERRRSNGSVRIRIERRDQPRPKQWAKFLRNDANKSELVDFLLQEWAHPTQFVSLFDLTTTLYVNNGSKFHKLTLNDGRILCEEQELLNTDQEEADTKVFLTRGNTWNSISLHIHG